MAGKSSLFSALWSKKDIPEDFRTEILSFVLNILSKKGELRSLFQKMQISINKFELPEISTQKTTATERFDIFIEDSDKLIIFENKWDSPTDTNQLIRYDTYLSASLKKDKFLIHLTKDYRPIDPSLFENKFYKRNWSDVYETLKEFRDDIVCEEFLKFLEEEGIAMEKISQEIINGSKSLYNLTKVIERACQEMRMTHRWGSGGSTDGGYTSQSITGEEGTISVYFRFKPSKLYFCKWSAQGNPYPEKLPIKWNDNYGIYFDFDEYNFFDKNLEKQVGCIKDFIEKFKQILSEANKLNKLASTETESE